MRFAKFWFLWNHYFRFRRHPGFNRFTVASVSATGSLARRPCATLLQEWVLTEGMKGILLTGVAAAVLLVACGKQSAETQRAQQSPGSVPRIRLVGITTILGNKRALLQVESPSNSQTQSLILGEHERKDQVEVLQIDDKSGRVQLSNSGVSTWLSLSEAAHGGK